MKEELSPIPALASKMLDLRYKYGDTMSALLANFNFLHVMLPGLSHHLASPTKSLETTSSSV
jgi:hypothetical protein